MQDEARLSKMFMSLDYDSIHMIDDWQPVEKRISEIDMSSELGADGYPRNLALPCHTTFIEDTQEELPFLLMF